MNEAQAFVNQNMAARNEHQAQMNQNQAARNEHQAHNMQRIQAPPVENNNFEVKASLLNIVQNSKFHGLPMEDPLDHIDQFDRVCNLTKINGVSEDGFKLRLFPFSLGDKSHQWEKNLPRGSIQTWDQSMKLVENLAMSNDTYGEDYERANRTEGSSKEQRMERELKELRSQVDKMMVASQKPIHFVGECDDQSPIFDNVNEEGLIQEELNYIGNQKKFQRYNNFNTNQNLSYRITNVANPQDQQLLQGQQRVENSYSDLGSKYEAIQQKIKELEKNQASSSRQQGTLPGKPEPNPKEYAHGITLRSGKCSLKTMSKLVGRQLKGDVVPEKPYVPPPPYQPKFPFTGRFKKQILEKARAVFDKQLRETNFTVPIIEAFLMIPQLGKFLKDAILNRSKELQGMVVLSHECSAIIQRKTNPRKLSDPGSLTLPCTIGHLKFSGCLCDLGASVSLMSFLVAQRLGFRVFKPAKTSLVLADRSVRLPIGLLEDPSVKVGGFEVPTDFIVLEMDEEPVNPLILGRPFLATSGAIIDVRGGKIELHLGSESLTLLKQWMNWLMSCEHGFLAEESEAYKMVLDQHKAGHGSENQFLEMETSGLEVQSIIGFSTSQGPVQECMAVGIEAEQEVKLADEMNTKEAPAEQGGFLADWDETKAPSVELKPFLALIHFILSSSLIGC
ncbi:uncharacterized protein LOC112083450 [Eutrema salsugineum]|uniref:uncharacterized protein LOC112083450 n=1 Tax=Eutrema salsugineum TaxID=72664 RepID=UPI000CED61D7|nr:uncharacterized protein LOC112083450 [Eutrema salsugineum]